LFNRKERSNLPQSAGYSVLNPNVGLLYGTKFSSAVCAIVVAAVVVVICWLIAKNNDNQIRIMVKVEVRIVDNWSL
jgi:uncharacterized membrane protein